MQSVQYENTSSGEFFLKLVLYSFLAKNSFDFIIDLTDIDECAPQGSNDCHSNSSCNNTDGSFACSCNSGFNGNGNFCEGLFNLCMPFTLYLYITKSAGKIPRKTLTFTSLNAVFYTIQRQR